MPETRELFQQTACKVASVARSERVAPPGNIAKQATALAETFGPGSFPSPHHDLTTSHRLELGAQLGELTPARHAASCGRPARARSPEVRCRAHNRRPACG